MLKWSLAAIAVIVVGFLVVVAMLARIKLEFFKPFAATNQTDFTFKPSADSTTVTPTSTSPRAPSAATARSASRRGPGWRVFRRAPFSQANNQYAVRVNCLDGVAPQELIDAPVKYFNMRHDDAKSPPAETRHL